MKNSRTAAKALDTTKDKILYTGLALLVGLAAAALFSSAAHAQTAVVKEEIGQSKTEPSKKIEGEWTPHIQVQDEIKLPFELKSQKLSH